MYEDIKEQLEEMLEECTRSGITPKDVDIIKDLVVSIYKLNGIIMAEEYGDYYGENTGSSGYSTGGYGARGLNARRDSRGRYRGRSRGRYGNDDMVKHLEEKMAHLSGEDQDVMRRAINIIERG